MEIWKTMEEHQNYEVSSFGKIRNKKTKRILKTTISYKGYEKFIVYVDKKPKCFYVHRVVANNFLKNPNGYKEINHINENKLDNKVENLEWCDGYYNLHYGTRIKRILKSKKCTFKKIVQKDIYGNIIRKWDNICDIQKETNYNKHSIYKCCEKKHNTAYGYKWEYADTL